MRYTQWEAALSRRVQPPHWEKGQKKRLSAFSLLRCGTVGTAPSSPGRTVQKPPVFLPVPSRYSAENAAPSIDGRLNPGMPARRGFFSFPDTREPRSAEKQSKTAWAGHRRLHQRTVQRLNLLHAGIARIARAARVRIRLSERKANVLLLDDRLEIRRDSDVLGKLPDPSTAAFRYSA